MDRGGMQKDVSVRVAWRIITTLVVAAIGSQGADFEHFTWWSIAWWAIYGMLEELGYGKSFFWFFMTIQILVISGVIIMGATDCTVFEEAFQKVGPTTYIIGNFAMHYLPSLVAFSMAGREHVRCGEPKAFVQIWAAFGMFLIWHHLRDPWSVYGCSLPHSLGVSGMMLITLALSITAQFVSER